MNRSLSRTPTQQQAVYKPGKSFMPNYGQINLLDQRRFTQNGDQETPKPFGFNQSFGQKPHLQAKDQLLNNPSPLFASGFAKDRAGIQNAKKRMYSEISNEMLQPSPYIGTPYMTFDDNSTIKPNQNTVVRNPTLMSLGIGRDDSRARGLNKTANIKPINLNITGFRLRDHTPLDIHVNDDSLLVDDNLIQNQTSFRPRRVEKYTQQFSKKDINLKCLSVQHILDHIFKINSNPAKNDIALVNSRGLSFEYQPLQYIVTNYLSLPPEILTLINKQYHDTIADDSQRNNYLSDIGIFESIQVGYFFQNQNLYLWPYAFPGRQEMAHQRYLNLNKIRSQLFNQAITCVAVCEPLPEMMVQAKDNKILIVSTSIELQIFIIKKDDDISEIQLIETEYKIPTDGDVVDKIVQFKKNNRIFYGGSEGHINEINLKSNKIDQFLQNISLGRKKLKRNDHQATSFLEKLLPGFIVDRSRKRIVDIKFDESRNYLYSMSVSLHEDTYGQSEIELFDLGIFGNQFIKIVSIKQYQILEAFIAFQKISIFGKGFDILKLSENFKIIFMQPLQTNESQISHLILITETGERIYISFDVKEIDPKKQESQINQEAIVDFFVTDRFKKDWIIRDVLKFPKMEETEELFEIAYKNGFFKCIGGNIASQSLQLNRDSIFYDSQESCLLYTVNIFDEEDKIPQTQTIKFNFIRKNESTYAALKQSSRHESTVQISELCSQFDLAVLPKGTQDQFNLGIDADSFFNESNENIYQIKVINSYRNAQLQKLLGFDRSFKDYKGELSTVYQQYLCLDIYDKQTYLDQRRFQIITDQRVIEVTQMRPIDQLVMILHTLTRPQCNNMEDFEDFLDLHSFKEVCSMLIQIISDTSGKYFFCRRVESMICGSNKSKNGRQAQSQPRQQMRSLITGTSQVSYHQSPIRMANQRVSHQSISHDFRNCYELKKFGGPYQLYAEYSYQKCSNEIVNNKIRQFLIQKSIARKLLAIYGDCINIQAQIRSKNDFIGEPISIDQFSYKHLAIYEYLQRLLRPFIDINILYNNFQEYGKEVNLPTIESLAYTQEKLAELLEFVTKYYPQLQGETLKSDEFLDYEQNSFIRYEYLKDRVLLVDELKSDEKYNLEVLEQNSIINLKLYIQRCIHATQIINLLNNENDRKKQEQFWRNLKKLQQQVSNLAFRDLLNNDNNSIIKDILNVLLDQEKQVKPKIDQRQINQFRSTREGQIQLLIGQMFTKQEEKAFRGERMLVEAINEQDQQRKDYLLEQSLKQMIDEPSEVDLEKIAPLLVQLGNFTSLIEITLNKLIVLKTTPAKQLKNLDDHFIEFYIDQAYQIIIQTISAIDYSLRKDDTKFLDKLMNSKDYTLLDIMIKKLNKVNDSKLKINLRQNIMRKIEQVGDIVLLAAIYEYQLKKPSTIFDLDSFPKISKEAFETICDNAIFSDSIQKDYLDSLIILLQRNGEAKRLCEIVLNICNNKQAVYVDSESQVKVMTLNEQGKEEMVKVNTKLKEDQRVYYNIDMNERRKMLDQAETVLLSARTLGTDDQAKYSQQLRICMEKVKLQQMIINNYQEFILALQQQREDLEDKLNNRQRKDKSKLVNDEIQQIEQKSNQIIELSDKKQLLNERLFDIQDLMIKFVEQDELYETKLLYNLRNESKHKEGKINQSISQKWVDTIFNLFSGVQLYNKLKEKLSLLNENERQQVVIPSFISEVALIVNLQNVKPDVLTEPSINKEQRITDQANDLKKLLDSHSLRETRFWFYELCFQMEELKIKPSQLIGYLINQADKIQESRMETQSHQGRYKFEVNSDDQLFKFLCLMKLWVKRHRDLFKDQQNIKQIIQNQSLEIAVAETPQKIFHSDVTSVGKTFYTQLIMSFMKDYISHNGLVFHKAIKDIVDKLYEQVQTQFFQMLTDHGVNTLQNQSTDQQQQKMSFYGSDRQGGRSMLVSNDSKAQRSQSMIAPKQILGQTSPIFANPNNSLLSSQQLSNDEDVAMQQIGQAIQGTPLETQRSQTLNLQGSQQQSPLDLTAYFVRGIEGGFNTGKSRQQSVGASNKSRLSRIHKSENDNLTGI